MVFYLNEFESNFIYKNIAFFGVCSLIVSCILMIISYFIVQQSPNKEKISVYECGFEPFEDARNKYDVRFYIVAILFLIFDIEVIYLFPWCVSLNVLGYQGFWVMVIFLLILILGFIYEIFMGALDWQ